MLTVTFKLKNPPTKGDNWLLRYGAKSPYATHSPDWYASGSTTPDQPIMVSMGEDIRYLKVYVRVKETNEITYQYETTEPTTFKDNTTYDWDCATNSLSVEAPEPVPGKFLDNIFSFVWDISDWFQNLYENVPDYGWLTDWIKIPLLFISELFWKLLTPIAHFGAWVDDVAAKVSNILSSVDIISLLKTWLTKADDAWDWVREAPTKVFGLATNWWEDPDNPIRPVIDGVIQLAKDLVANLQKEVTEVHTAWDDFWTISYPKLITAAEAFNLFDSTLKTWFPSYDDLVKLWVDTKLFVSNPLDWLWEQFTDWFLGKE